MALPDCDSKLRCPRCVKPAVEEFSWEDLLEHYGSSHSGLCLFHCPNCAKGFVSGNLFRKHGKNVCQHDGPLPVVPDPIRTVDPELLEDFYTFQREAIAFHQRGLDREADIRSTRHVGRTTPGDRDNEVQSHEPLNRGTPRPTRRRHSDSDETSNESPQRKMKTRSAGPADEVTVSGLAAIERDARRTTKRIATRKEDNEEDSDQEGDFEDYSSKDDSEDGEEEEEENEEEEEDDTASLDSGSELPSETENRMENYERRHNDDHQCEHEFCCWPTQLSQPCPFCFGNHRETSCPVVWDIDERVNLYKSQHICYRCGGNHHRAPIREDCLHRKSLHLPKCQFCKRRDHVSAICRGEEHMKRRESLLLLKHLEANETTLLNEAKRKERIERGKQNRWMKPFVGRIHKNKC